MIKPDIPFSFNIYTAIAFSLIVELVNMRVRKKSEPVKLNDKKP
ncbi:MAG: hypothetical protein V4676_03005 [Bacteroidota bacterium]